MAGFRFRSSSQKPHETAGSVFPIFPWSSHAARRGSMKLTQKVADTLSLPRGRGEIIAFDDTLPGFGLRIRSTGGRSWIYQYKVGPRHRRVTLGNASAIKLEQARANASKLHAQVRLGHDVAAERDDRRAKVAETFGATVALYLPRQQGRVRAAKLCRDRALSDSLSEAASRHAVVHDRPQGHSNRTHENRRRARPSVRQPGAYLFVRPLCVVHAAGPDRRQSDPRHRAAG